MKPLVSVIIPVYNSEKTIKKCIDSILDQTLTNIEIIVVNDNSTDNTLNILNEYNDIILINNKKNLGPSKSRNKGLKIAKGKYIGFVDSDDYIKENMYEVMSKLMKEKDVDLVCCSRYNIENSIVRPIITRERLLPSKNFLDNSVYIWDKLFKKSIIDKYKIFFPIDSRFGEDVNFLYQYYYYSNMSYFTNVPLYFHINDRNDSITNLYDEKNFDLLISLKGIIDFYKSKNEFENFELLILEICARSYIWRIRRFNRYNNVKFQKQIVKSFLKFFKQNFKNYKKVINRCLTKQNLFYRSNYYLMVIYIYYINLNKKLCK